MDLPSLADSIALFRAGMDGLRTGIGIARDARELLPKHEGEQLEASLARSEQALARAEIQILQGIGFPICHCTPPGVAMLTIGRQRRRRGGFEEMGLEWVQLHECPRCKLTDRAVAASVELRDQPTPE